MKVQDAFRKIINPDVVLDIITGDRELVLREKGVNSKINKLHITNVPVDSFAFTLDYDDSPKNKICFQQLSIYLNRALESVNKSCDLVLVIPDLENKYKILILDLKSDKPNLNDTEKQLLNSELYVRYILSMLQYHYKMEVENIFIIFSIVKTGQPRKGPTYSPNHSKQQYEYSFRIKSVAPRRGEASIHLNALLK